MANRAQSPRVAQRPFCDHCHDRKAWVHIDLTTDARPNWCEDCLGAVYPALRLLVRQQISRSAK